MKIYFFILVALLGSGESFGQIHCLPSGVYTVTPAVFVPMFTDNCKSILSEGRWSEEAEQKYCKCLAISSKRTLFSRLAADHARQDVDKDIAKKMEENKKQLLKMYTKLNFGIGLQENIYGIESQDGKVGCTPENLAEEVASSIEKLNKSKLSQKLSFNKINDTWSPPVDTSFVKGGEFVPPQINSEGDIGKYFSKDGTESKDRNVDTLNNAAEFFNKFPELLKSVASVEVIRNYAKTIKKKGFGSLSTEEKYIFINIEDEFLKKMAYVDAPEFKEKQKTIDKNALKSQFENSNKEIVKDLKKSYQTALPGACVDYSAFKVYNSSPSDEMFKLLDRVESSSAVENLLDYKHRSPVVLKFLSSNPILAKNVINPAQRKLLAEKLKTFANKVSGKSRAERLPAFLSFMKNDVAEINKKSRTEELLHCKVLGQNFAASLGADNLPEWGALYDAGDAIQVLRNNISYCEVKMAKSGPRATQNNVTQLLESDPLFTIFNSDSTDEFNPAEDKAYHDYLAEACPDFKEYAAKTTGASCADGKICDHLITDSSKRKKLLNEYFSKRPELNGKEIADTVKAETKQVNTRKLVHKFKERKQSQQVREKFNTYVKSVVDERSIYSREDIFASDSPTSNVLDAVNKAQSTFDIPSASGHVASAPQPQSQLPVTPQASAASAAAAVNQVIAPYLNPGSTTAKEKTVNSISEAKEAIAAVQKNPTKENVDLLEEAKEYLEDSEETNSEIAGLKSKVAEMEKQIADSGESSSTVIGRAPASASSVAPAPASAPKIIPVVAFSPVAAPIQQRSELPSPKVDKASVSMNAHLSATADLRAAQQGIGIVEDMDRQYQFDGRAPIELAEIKGNAILIESPLSLDSKEFLVVSGAGGAEALKEYLKDNAVAPDSYISIKCAGNECPTEGNEMVLHISKDFKIRAVARGVRVASTQESYEKYVRETTYNDLKSNMQDILKH